jgi:hypothetical protein
MNEALSPLVVQAGNNTAVTTPVEVEQPRVKRKYTKHINRFTRRAIIEKILSTPKWIKKIQNGKTFMDWSRIAAENPDWVKPLQLRTIEGKQRLSVAVAQVRNQLAKTKSECPVVPQEALAPAQTLVSKRLSFCPDCGTAIEQNTWNVCPVCGLALNLVTINRK